MNKALYNECTNSIQRLYSSCIQFQVLFATITGPNPNPECSIPSCCVDMNQYLMVYFVASLYPVLFSYNIFSQFVFSFSR